MQIPHWLSNSALIVAAILLAVMVEVVRPKHNTQAGRQSFTGKGLAASSDGTVSAMSETLLVAAPQSEPGTEAAPERQLAVQTLSTTNNATAPQREARTAVSLPRPEPLTDAHGHTVVVTEAPTAIEDEENLCPKYWGGPCTRDAHTNLPCNHPWIPDMLRNPPGVRYLWCIENGREVRLNGVAAPPEPNPIAPRFASSELAAKVSFAVSSEWGWHRAAPGDRYCPRIPRRGWCDESQPAVEGAYYLAYAGRLTHVTLLPCEDERVLEAVGKGWPNVFCTTGEEITRFNADDAAATPLRVYSDHDRINEGRATEVTK